MFGSPRSGSTWLLRLIAYPWGVGRTPTGIDPSRFRPAGPDVVPINESYLVHHLAPLREVIPQTAAEGTPLVVNDLRRTDPAYFFSDTYRDVWRDGARELALGRFAAQHDRAIAEHGMGAEPLVVIKEPNGSHGAEQIADLLPASRILFLLRDGRDVVDSMLEADSPGGWRTRVEGVEALATPEQRLAAIRRQSQLWLVRTEATQRACARLAAEQTIVVRYEDLLADTEAELGRLDGWLGIDRGTRGAGKASRHHRFGSLRNRLRGRRKGVRAASPGLWRQNLSADEQAAMGKILGAKLAELDYEV